MTDTLTEIEVTKLQDILIGQLDVKRDELKPDADLVQDLNADSLDVVEILMKTEESFNLNIPDEEAEKVKTVQELYDAVGKLLGGSDRDGQHLILLPEEDAGEPEEWVFYKSSIRPGLEKLMREAIRDHKGATMSVCRLEQ